MLKIRLFLMLQCAASIYLTYQLHAPTSTVQNFALVTAGYYFTFIPLVIGVFLLGMTLFPIERRNGTLYYDPNVPAWRFAQRLDGSYRDEIRWCVINWKLMGILAIIAFVAGIVTLITFAPLHPHPPINWGKTLKDLAVVYGVFMLFAAPLGLAAYIMKKYEWAKNVVVCLIIIYGGSLFLFCCHGSGLSWIVIAKKMAIIIATAGGTVGGIICLVFCAFWVVDRIKETAFGIWTKNLCPTLTALPDGQH